MRPTLTLLLLAGTHGLTPAKNTRPRVVLSPCSGSVGLCLLRSLKSKDCDVVAICQDEAEEARVRQNTCGCSMRQGEVTDMCDASYPALETMICGSPRELRKACEGASAVVALPAGDAHPRLAPNINHGTIVRPTVAATKKSADVARRLVAASDENAHVVLLSALGAGAEPGRPWPRSSPRGRAASKRWRRSGLWRRTSRRRAGGLPYCGPRPWRRGPSSRSSIKMETGTRTRRCP